MGRMRWAGHVAYTWEKRKVCRDLFRNLEKRKFGRRKYRWEIYIRIGIETVCNGAKLIAVAEDEEDRRVLTNSVMRHQAPHSSRDLLTITQLRRCPWLILTLN
jgi:hypothetical protein